MQYPAADTELGLRSLEASFGWLPGHLGQPGEELADLLLGEGLESALFELPVKRLARIEKGCEVTSGGSAKEQEFLVLGKQGPEALYLAGSSAARQAGEGRVQVLHQDQEDLAAAAGLVRKELDQLLEQRRIVAFLLQLGNPRPQRRLAAVATLLKLHHELMSHVEQQDRCRIHGVRLGFRQPDGQIGLGERMLLHPVIHDPDEVGLADSTRTTD